MWVTPAQVAGYVKAAGWPATEIHIATAVALAESGERHGASWRADTAAVGDEHLVNDKWGPSIGLFQIRSLHAEKGKGTKRDELANRDPLTNARHALAIRREQGLTAWTLFNSAKMFAALPFAILGARNPLAPVGDVIDGAQAAAGAVRGSIDAVTDGVGAVVKAGAWMSDRGNWVRVSKVITGVGLVWVGISIVVGPPVSRGIGTVVGKAEKVASFVAPAGKAAGAARGAKSGSSAAAPSSAGKVA